MGQQKLIAAVLRYAKAVHAGRLTEAGFLEDWGLRPAPYDPAPDFNQALIQDKLGPWLDSLPPPYTGYQSLTQGLTAYRAIAAKGGWKPISRGPALKLGSTDPRVTELRARLAAEDATVAADGPPLFDDALAEGVKRAQKRFGLKDDGVVSAATLAALNVRSRTGSRRSSPTWSAGAGCQPSCRWTASSEHRSGRLDRVPRRRADLVDAGGDRPARRRDADAALAGPEHRLQSAVERAVLDRGQGAVAEGKGPPWLFRQARLHHHPHSRRRHAAAQRAGDQAALGKIKFDFPNPYGVYLHDTPGHAAFDRYSRLESHGCVRLQKPLLLANNLLQGDPVWTPAKVDETIASGKTVRASVPPADLGLPVLLDRLSGPRRPDELPRRPVQLGQDADSTDKRGAPAQPGA